MGQRFDQIELYREPGHQAPVVTFSPVPPPSSRHRPASRWKRLLAFLTDLSLFAALALAMSPLLPERGDLATTLDRDWPSLTAFATFLLMISFYYFAGCWLIWGKTVGGAIFDVRVVSGDGTPLSIAAASKRWLSIFAAVATLGIGFAMALLPRRQSLSDRLSASSCIDVS